jgi:hypothetical protein
MKNYPAIVIALFFASPLHAEMREWTSSADPTKKIKGEFKSSQGDMVSLKMANGRVVNFEISKLSLADQDFIKKLKAPKTTSADKNGSALPGTVMVVEDFVFGEVSDEVYQRLKKHQGLKGGVNEILRGRTGLNDMYFIELDEVRYGLFFDFDEDSDGLKEVSLQSQGYTAEEYETALKEAWTSIQKRLEAENGKAAMESTYPAKSVITEGVSMSTGIWKSKKGEIFLGIGQNEGKFSVVVRTRKEPFLTPQ